MESYLEDSCPTQVKAFPMESFVCLCHLHSESICHLLFSCPFAKEVWDRSGVQLPAAGFSRSSIPPQGKQSFPLGYVASVESEKHSPLRKDSNKLGDDIIQSRRRCGCVV
uniref:Reverse transcriptase zinc-binding domain-containing protein n=1 Tax=Brassica oleracea TaxID=3712 RepID=A0A3P6GM08_BRAOL|nr:unnamed protein product [Brassica oleracea]